MAQINQIRRDGFSVSTDDAVRREAILIKRDCALGFIPLGFEVGHEGFENLDAFMLADLGHEEIAMLRGVLSVAGSVVVENQTKEVAHGFDGSGVSHLDAQGENIGRSFAVRIHTGTLNGDAALSVQESSEVSKFMFHANNGSMNYNQKQGSHKRNSANSVDTRTGKAEGNTEPSIALTREGVCREHIRNPKGMMCSELHSNMQSMAEMTMPLSVS